MPYKMQSFEIKMLSQERIKGPLPPALSTAGSAVKFDFFFTFSPFATQQNVQNGNQPIAVPQTTK